MRNRLLSGCLFCIFFTSIHANYEPDVLGGVYVCRTIQMADDYEGPVVCTLVKKPALPNVKQALLYIHGYNDYFFQSALGDSIEAHGYNFYAIDLRKYGRSIRPHQDPFNCRDLSEYYADIDSALAIIRSEGNDSIVLMGHSTGGLITSLYLETKKESVPVNKMILNSPFLDMKDSWLMENIILPLVAFIGKWLPELVVSGKGVASYCESLLADYHGEWTFDPNWKKIHSHPKKAGWVKAIHQGHKRAQKGLTITCPVLILSSDHSYTETADWDDNYLSADIILDVEEIQRYGAGLGSAVTRKQITNGMHDLILSSRTSRDETYRTIFSWLEKK